MKKQSKPIKKNYLHTRGGVANVSDGNPEIDEFEHLLRLCLFISDCCSSTRMGFSII